MTRCPRRRELETATNVSRETSCLPRPLPAGPARSTAGARHRVLLIGLSLLAVLLFAACGRIASPEGWADPVVTDGTALAALQRGKLSAISIDTGQETWRFPSQADKKTDLKAIYGTPAVGGGRVYVGGFNGTLYALDLTTGAVIWQQETGGAIIGAPALADGTVYVGSSDSKLYAFDAGTGTLRWTPFKTGGSIWSRPVVEGGTVYVTSMDKRLYALDSATGESRWPQPFEAHGAMPSTPALAGNTLYVGALDDRLYAIDASSGKEVWSFEASNWVWCEPLVANGVVYFGGLDHRLYALDAATGGERWPQPLRAKGPIRARPALAAGVLIVTDNAGDVYGLDPATGEERWPAITLQSGVLANPVVVGNDVYLSTRGGELLRVDAAAGSSTVVAPLP
jgi:outer membrane protein assembly factor BamB